MTITLNFLYCRMYLFRQCRIEADQGRHDVKHVEADHILQMKQMEQIAEIKTVIKMKTTWESIIIFLPSSIP